MSSRQNLPVPPRTRRFRNASTQLRYLWLVVTGVVGGFSSFVIYDRFYHAVEVSQLLVVSVDTMNVMGGMPDQIEEAVAKTENNKRKNRGKRNKNVQELVDDVKDIPKLKKEQVNNLVEAAQKEEKEETDQHGIQQEKHQYKGPNKDKLFGADPSSVVRSLEDLDEDERYKVYFLNETQVNQRDSFSASWLQSKQDFMEMKLELVQICEDAAFKAWNSRRDKLRMPLDYFDFSVEHMSKWWKLLFYHQYEVVYDTIMTRLGAYVEAGITDYPTPKETPVLEETVVVIAFQPYGMGKREAKNELYVERAHNLTVVSLAATLESLRRAEMGRVVVVGSEESHEDTAKEAFDYLDKHSKIEPVGDTTKERKYGHMELAFALATPEMTRTKHLVKNMPKGALVGARKAFTLADQETKTEEEQQFLDTWFGKGRNPQFWKYLYLTEPDSILTTRSTSLPQIKNEIDSGFIVSPFRLQPIAHESDIRGYPVRNRMLPEADGFETVLELDHYADSHDVCCDEHMGMDHRPGKPPYFQECGSKKWFNCGFEEKVPSKDPHRRLRPYQLFRLTKGTGITMIAGNLFARRCFAGQNSVCRPPHVS